jgi:hypothetical protein
MWDEIGASVPPIIIFLSRLAWVVDERCKPKTTGQEAMGMGESTIKR